jgi:nitroimidazol reductase NimA-like FMN-containing flavoprotein (pyridoxamine 5'-phosphate oxidase superfamily)
MTADAPHLSPTDRERAEALLKRAPIVFVAMVEWAGPAAGPGSAASARPYVVPMNFAYEPAEHPGADPGDLGRLYLHTGEGRKSAAFARNTRVCAVVTADESFDKGATPCNDGFAFRSVLVEGRATLLEARDQREKALRAIVAKYDPDVAAMPFTDRVLAHTLVYVVGIETLSYKTRPRRRRL